jgi:glycosyltransferase involved in cell wall biosynthesis
VLFLYCSKIVKHKRPLDVLRAFVVPCYGYVASGARIRGRWRADARAAEPRSLGHVVEADVHVLGFRNQSELPEIYGACDVFVQASEREPWGMVVNEAMASGMAICASDQWEAPTTS